MFSVVETKGGNLENIPLVENPFHCNVFGVYKVTLAGLVDKNNPIIDAQSFNFFNLASGGLVFGRDADVCEFHGLCFFIIISNILVQEKSIELFFPLVLSNNGHDHFLYPTNDATHKRRQLGH